MSDRERVEDTDRTPIVEIDRLVHELHRELVLPGAVARRLSGSGRRPVRHASPWARAA